MNRFVHGHAAHPDAGTAFSLAAVQIDARLAELPAPTPTLGWLYLSDRLAQDAPNLLALASRRWPGVAWVGAVGVGVCAGGVEYFDEPALAMMLADLPREDFRVFSGAQPLPADFVAHTALVHADPSTPDLAELIDEMSQSVASGYLFGGLASSQQRRSDAHATSLIADAALSGGLSGVAFAADVALVSRVSQGCQPVGPNRRVTGAERNIVTTLDGRPALDALLADLGLAGVEPRAALPRLRQTLVGLADASPASRRVPGAFGPDVRVRHLVGLDPARRAIAIGDVAQVGQSLAFCTRNAQAARLDLTRICAEIRDELEPESLPHELAVGDVARAAGLAGQADAAAPARRIAGAVYVSCVGRGGAHFGAPSAELAIVRRGLGEVPLVGFFAAGEIGHRHLYGYTGVLTVFVQ